MQVAIFHGINASPRQMAPLQRHLEGRGHDAVAIGYSSRSGLDEGIAAGVRAVEQRFPAGKIALVGFSAGGLVARGVMAALPAGRRELLVQIAPPNRGAARAGWLIDRALATPFISRGFRDLAPGSALIATLPVPECPIGILAGDVTFHPKVAISYFATAGGWLFGRGELAVDGDGSVGLEETKLPRGVETDRLVLPYAHDYFPLAEGAHRQVAHFLEHRSFRRPAE